MSSETHTPQQLYEAEHLRAQKLEKAVIRGEAELKGVEAELTRANETIDDLEVASENKDKQLRIKDDTIQNLHSAFEDADQPHGSSDNETIKELRAKLQLLETQIKELEQKLLKAVNGDWDTVIPLVEQGLIKRTTEVASKQGALQRKLLSVKTELSDASALVAYLEDNLQALNQEFEQVIAEIENHAGGVDQALRRDMVDSFRAIMDEDEYTCDKLMNKSKAAKRKFAAFKNEPRPVPQAAQPQCSGGPTNSPPARDSNSRSNGNDGEPVKTPPRSALAKEKVSEVTKKHQEEGLEASTTPAEKETVHATQGPKKTPWDEQLAYFSAFFPLAFDGKPPPEPAIQTERSRYSQQPFPSPSRVRALATAPEAPATASLQNRGSIFKPALHENKGALTQPKFPFNPTTNLFAPGASRTMAQVAADSSKPNEHPGLAFLASLDDEPRAKANVSEMRTMKAARSGTIVEPGEPKARTKQASQTVTHSAAHSTCFESAHSESFNEVDRRSTQAPQTENIVECSNSPAESETVRPKDRKTLHSLAPH